MPLGPRIRLVKGAYAEPATIAWQQRKQVDANYLALCVSMLDAKRAGADVFLGLGTHDVELIEQVADHAETVGLAKTDFDVEMLYGIRADQQRRLAKSRLQGARADRLRRGVVPVVHAPAGRAAGQRRLRAAADSAVLSRLL